MPQTYILVVFLSSIVLLISCQESSLIQSLISPIHIRLWRSKALLPFILPSAICKGLVQVVPLRTCPVKFNYYRAMHFSAKCGIAIACRLSLRPSVTLVNCDHIGWNSSKIITIQQIVSCDCRQYGRLSQRQLGFLSLQCLYTHLWHLTLSHRAE